MESRNDVFKEILHGFLDRWPIDRVKEMTLDEYVSVHNPDTFCQWVETKTVALGNIKGPAGSIKLEFINAPTRTRSQEIMIMMKNILGKNLSTPSPKMKLFKLSKMKSLK